MKGKDEKLPWLRNNNIDTCYNSKQNELLSSGTSIFTTSLTHFLAKSPSTFTKLPNFLPQEDLLCPLIKSSSMFHLHQMKFSDKKKHEGKIKTKLENFHRNTLRDSLKEHYKPSFLTRTSNINSPRLTTYRNYTLRDLNNPSIDIPKIGMLKQHMYPSQTSSDFTKKCLRLAQIGFLSVFQKKTLNDHLKHNKDTIDNVNNQIQEINRKNNIMTKDYKENLLSYIHFLNQKAKEEIEELKKLKDQKSIHTMEIDTLSRTIDTIKRTLGTQLNMRLFLICAKEAINKGNNSNNCIQRKKLFYASDEELSNNTPIQNDIPSFYNALDRMDNHKELKAFFLNKYHNNFLLFDSAEDFISQMKFYEDKILKSLQIYEKHIALNNSLKIKVKQYNDDNNDLFVLESNSSRIKENKLHQVQELYYQLIRKKANLLNKKRRKSISNEFKIPQSISSLFSPQSDSIFKAFKYQSIAKDYPIPFTCLYYKLCLIVNTIQLNSPNFLIIDPLISNGDFDLDDLNELLKKKYDESSEDEIQNDIIILLKIIEKSFLEIIHTYYYLSKQKTTTSQFKKIKEDIEHQKKIKGIKEQRFTAETIRKLILDNVAKKASKITFKQSRKIDRIDHRQHNQCIIEKKKDYKNNSDIQDYLYD